jgi:competence protein ComGC
LFIAFSVLLFNAANAQAASNRSRIEPKEITAFPGGADQPPVYGIPGGADQPPVFVIPGGADQPTVFGLDNIQVHFEVLSGNFVLTPAGADQPPKKSVTELFVMVKNIWIPRIAERSPEARYLLGNKDFMLMKSGLPLKQQAFLDAKFAGMKKGQPLRLRGEIKIIDTKLSGVNQPYIAVLKSFSGVPDRKSMKSGVSAENLCHANMRVLLGAVEMYNMDHSEMINIMDESVIKKLMSEGYLLKSFSRCPAKGKYKNSGDLSSVGVIECTTHGRPK